LRGKIRSGSQHRGLSLRSLAEKIGTSPSALSDIETGKSEGRLSILRRVAGALAVGPEALLPPAGRDERTLTNTNAGLMGDTPDE
jgi:transcriptional regulator with XRE-family HTH domain